MRRWAILAVLVLGVGCKKKPSDKMLIEAPMFYKVKDSTTSGDIEEPPYITWPASVTLSGMHASNCVVDHPSDKQLYDFFSSLCGADRQEITKFEIMRTPEGWLDDIVKPKKGEKPRPSSVAFMVNCEGMN